MKMKKEVNKDVMDILLIAGGLEVLGVVLLNELSRTQNKIYVILLGLAFILSFSTLKLAMHDIPMGTAYAIWTGIGTAGGTIIGMLFYKESKTCWKNYLYSNDTYSCSRITFN